MNHPVASPDSTSNDWTPTNKPMEEQANRIADEHGSQIQYRESLPPDCPPPSARAITEQTVRYRLLEGVTPAEEDFDSYAKRNSRPNPDIRRTPCEQSGLSVFVSLEAARWMMTGRLNDLNRWQSIGVVTISAGAGKMNPAERNGHQTWWPSQALDPVNNCKVIR